MSATLGTRIIDGDGHIMEDTVAIIARMESPYREIAARKGVAFPPLDHLHSGRAVETPPDPALRATDRSARARHVSGRRRPRPAEGRTERRPQAVGADEPAGGDVHPRPGRLALPAPRSPPQRPPLVGTIPAGT